MFRYFMPSLLYLISNPSHPPNYKYTNTKHMPKTVITIFVARDVDLPFPFHLQFPRLSAKKSKACEAPPTTNQLQPVTSLGDFGNQKGLPLYLGLCSPDIFSLFLFLLTLLFCFLFLSYRILLITYCLGCLKQI